MNRFYLYKIQHEDEGEQFVFCSYTPLEKYDLVICRTRYGRQIGIVIDEATINDLVDFVGLKPCGPASDRQLLQAGWQKKPNGRWRESKNEIEEEYEKYEFD